MASRSRGVPASGRARHPSSTCSMRARYDSMRADSDVIARESLGPGRRAAVFGYAEGLDTGLSVAFQEDLDFLLGRFQGSLAVTRQFHAALESLESLFEWQIATLQALHQAFQLAQRAFKVRCIGTWGRCLRIARQESSLKCVECILSGAPRYTAGNEPATWVDDPAA